MSSPQLGPIANILFFSRWLQLPLCLGLVVAQAVCVRYRQGVADQGAH
jgi:uncharacterized membrane protein YqhA